MIVVSVSNGRWLNIDQVSLAQGGGTEEKKILYVWFANSVSFKKRDAMVFEGEDANKIMAAMITVHRRNWPPSTEQKIIPANILPMPPKGKA